MEKLLDYIKSNPVHAISVPAVLCFIQFVTNLFWEIRTNNFDNNVWNQLLTSADGFEAVVLLMVMVVLREEKK